MVQQFLINLLFFHQQLHHLREKSSAEVSELEGIAQAHYSRANRLNDELNYLRAEHLELRQHLQDLNPEKKLQESLLGLKSDLKAVSVI